tara:strand:- start:688 stop:1257 length:570 start_codon:yes stop_codon:yes gene_type:complete
MTHRIVAAFDFDGTITNRDTLVPFLKEYGTWKITKGSLETLIGVRQESFRDSLKRSVLREIFLGYPKDQLEEDGRNYATSLPRLYRSEIIEHVKEHKNKGHELVLVTASLGCYARPAALTLGFDHIIAVELNSKSGRLTGEMTGSNIRGPEKARLLRRYLGYGEVDLWAYGNSAGDTQMLQMADHAQKV